ncbi:nicotinate phosphoribosyltransferase, partial [Toxoplasma gondii RUB]
MEKNQSREKRRRGSSLAAAEDASPEHCPHALGNASSPSLMLTDWYQLSMLYANWRVGKHNQHAVFEGFFRKAPFQGEFAVMAGVKQVVEFISNMRFSEENVEFFRTQFPHASEEFFNYLRSVDCSDLCIH